MGVPSEEFIVRKGPTSLRIDKDEDDQKMNYNQDNEEIVQNTIQLEDLYIGERIKKVPTVVKSEYKKSASNLWEYVNLGSELLENTGAVARDHMSNERTFLSWIRTSLGLATVGVGITQLFKLVKFDGKMEDSKQTEFLAKAGKYIGAIFIIVGITCVFLGTSRFFRTQNLLKEDKYPASRFSVSLLVFLIIALSIATLASVLHYDTR